MDGKDPWDGERFVISPNSTLELKGDKANKAFRFIQKTQKISEHRGDRIDDGIVRIEFQFEKALPEVKTVYTHTNHIHHDYYHPNSYWYGPYHGGCYGAGGYRRSLLGNSLNIGAQGSSGSGGGSSFTASNGSPVTVTASFNANSMGEVHDGSAAMDSCDMSVGTNIPVPEVAESGITVAGQKVDQNFNYVQTRELETTTHAIVLQLFGLTESQKPVTLQDHSRAKKKCPTCGKVNSPVAKFCSECGTNIE